VEGDDGCMNKKRDCRSRTVTEGLERMPRRAFPRTCGYDGVDIDKPRVG
jgi:hypothetical protein